MEIKKVLKRNRFIANFYRRVFFIKLNIKYILFDNNRNSRDIKKYGGIQVKSIKETLTYIINNRCSVARYGDGEFSLIEGRNIGFQNKNYELGEKLLDVLSSNSKRIIICIPDVFNELDKYIYKSKIAWSCYLTKNRNSIYKNLDKDKVYHNSFMTRPYMIFKNKNTAVESFNLIKKIWEDREVVIVEGEKTRFGVGNDFLFNSKSIERILVPTENCFSKYDEIYNEVLKYDKSKLVLLAAGPVATVLAYDLSKCGYQAIDIGHADIEYEWFNRKAIEKINIEYKYINEAVGGQNVIDVIDPSYKKQIKRII